MTIKQMQDLLYSLCDRLSAAESRLEHLERRVAQGDIGSPTPKGNAQSPQYRGTPYNHIDDPNMRGAAGARPPTPGYGQERGRNKFDGPGKGMTG